MLPVKADRKSNVPRPLRKPNKLSGIHLFVSKYQSMRFLIIYSISLHDTKKSAIERYATGEVLDLGIEITSKCRHASGIIH